MKRSFILTTTLVFLLGLPGLCPGHEFLLKPEPWAVYRAGQKLPVAAYFTHVFIKGEQAGDTETLVLTYNGQTVPTTVNEAWHRQDANVTLQAGGAAIIEGRRLPVLWSETPGGGGRGGRDVHKDAFSVGRYEKFAKLLLPVDGNSTGFDRVCGHRLEIVPVDNPLTARPGDELTLGVLLDGRPAVIDVIEASYDGFTDIPEALAYTAAPVRHGTGKVKITAPGLWFIRVAVTVPGNTKDCDEEYLRAVLLFPVR